MICSGFMYNQHVHLRTLENNSKVMEKELDEYKANLEKSKSAHKVEVGLVSRRYDKVKGIAPTLYHEVVERKISSFHDTMIRFGLPSEENLHFYSSFVSFDYI